MLFIKSDKGSDNELNELENLHHVPNFIKEEVIQY